MRRLVVAVLMGVVCGTGSGCGPKDQAMVEQTCAQTIKAFQPVSYTRGDGRGGQDSISIDESGKIQFKGRMMGQASGQISQFQMMQLAQLCEGWQKLSGRYGVAGSAEVVAITVGQKTVTVTDGTKDLPEQLVLVRQKIETLARDLPATRP